MARMIRISRRVPFPGTCPSAVLLVSLAAFALAACGESDPSTAPDDSSRAATLAAQPGDACRAAATDAFHGAQDYRHSVNRVRRECTDGSCGAPLVEAEDAYESLVLLHEAMVATCGTGGDPAGDDDGGVVPGAGDLVINEIMFDPAGTSDADGEWFEIRNATSVDIQLQGSTVEVGGGQSFLVDASVVVPAGGFVVLARNGDVTANGGVQADFDYPDGIALSNANSEVIAILDPDGALVDEASTWPFLVVQGEAQSLDVGIGAVGNDDSANWCPATDVYDPTNGNRGSPGSANPDCS